MSFSGRSQGASITTGKDAYNIKWKWGDLTYSATKRRRLFVIPDHKKIQQRQPIRLESPIAIIFHAVKTIETATAIQIWELYKLG